MSMLEKLISFITALIVSIASFFQGPPGAPTPTPPTTPRFDPAIGVVEPQKEAPTSTPTTKPGQVAIPKPKTQTQKPPAPPDAPRFDPAMGGVEPQNETKKSIEPRPIDLRSVAGLACYFENSWGQKTRYRGSGVIIREGTYSKGTYILTNRHVVDLEWTSKLPGGDDIDKDMKLKECEVHVFLGEKKILPEETYPYPYYDLKTMKGLQYDFKARLAYLPNTKELSEDENAGLDYAILEITGKNTSKYFEHENPRLPAAPILIPNPEDWVNTIEGSRVVMPGYAFQQEGSGSFDEFRLLTKDGIVREVYGGDRAFQNNPLSVSVEVPPDAYGGRSGSPIFYKGYLIGLVATKALPTPNSKDYRSPQPAITGIMENMKTQADIKKIFENIHYFE